ncbi:sensor histidine kinase [Micromonospora sp. AP08]|nr:sensor histidine kinase [Micromonospora sp. AP08]
MCRCCATPGSSPGNDTGTRSVIGVHRSAKPHSVSATVRAQPSGARDRAGAGRAFGLGLSIVRAVAQAHGGAVHAHPRDGGGLVVRVTLPSPGAAVPAQPARTLPAAARG